MAGAWWQQRGVLVALVLLTAVPILMVTLPPLTDYFGHMGRYRVQLDLASSPELQRNWDYRWALIANLGVDLLMVPLSQLLGLERAIWVIGLVLPPFLAWGLLRVAKAAHGHVPASAIAAIPFALAYPYQYGFVNFWLGLGLAFHLFAFWIGGNRTKAWHYIAFALASFALWVCHVFAWGVMCVLVGSHELARGWAGGERNPARLVWQGVLRSWCLMLPLALMVGWRQEGEGATTLGWFRWEHKLGSFLDTLRDQNRWLDRIMLMLALTLVYFGIREKDGRIHPGLGLAALIFLIFAILLPFQLFGSAYADARMWPVFMMVAVLSVRFEPVAACGAHIVAGAAALLLVVRIGLSTEGFARYERDNERHLGALAFVKEGSRVAVLARYPCPADWRRQRIEHLGSIALLRRNAFVNSQWDVPGAQLLRPLAATGTRFNADPSQFVVGKVCERDMRAEFGAKLAELPRDRFDYVWMLDLPSKPMPRYPGLKPLFADDRTILYAIEKDADKRQLRMPSRIR